MSENAVLTDDPRCVVVTRRNADSEEYVTATVHPSQESAEEYLTEVETSQPWFSHSVVTIDEHLNGSATDTGEEF